MRSWHRTTSSLRLTRKAERHGCVLSLTTLILLFRVYVQLLFHLHTQTSLTDLLRLLGGTFSEQSGNSRAGLAALFAKSFPLTLTSGALMWEIPPSLSDELADLKKNPHEYYFLDCVADKD